MLESLKSDPDIWLYLFVPVISALVGWGTNVLALKMTFYPIKFVGIPPIFGWQGIIPSKAGVMAGRAVDILTEKLINVEDRFAQIDPEQVVIEMKPELDRISRKIINEVMEAQFPLFWKGTPKTIREDIYQKLADDLPLIAEDMMRDIKANIKELFDLRAMVVAALIKDKGLLNDIFLKVGDREFRFIEHSGIYFGFLFGLIQMAVWYFYQPWWLLPLAGLMVGYATNWIALKLIFRPLNPVKFGPWTIQGLFIKRQHEVAGEYAQIVSDNILTSKNIFNSILHGNASEKLAAIVQAHVDKAVDKTAGNNKSLIELVAGTKKYAIAKNIAFSSFMEDFRVVISYIYKYTEDALDIENTLRGKMRALTPVEFEGFLHPVFEEDELKLILVGAALGCMAGFAQLFFIFS